MNRIPLLWQHIIQCLLLLLIGLCFHMLIPAVIFGAIFIPLRIFLGGYRCKSSLLCTLTFCITFVLILILGTLMLKWMDLSILLLLLLWCGLGIWFLGPVENIHKKNTKEQRKRCHNIAMGIYAIDFALAVACYLWSPYYGVVALLSLAAVVALLPIGTAVERRQKSHETGTS